MLSGATQFALPAAAGASSALQLHPGFSDCFQQGSSSSSSSSGLRALQHGPTCPCTQRTPGRPHRHGCKCSQCTGRAHVRGSGSHYQYANSLTAQGTATCSCALCIPYRSIRQSCNRPGGSPSSAHPSSSSCLVTLQHLLPAEPHTNGCKCLSCIPVTATQHKTRHDRPPGHALMTIKDRHVCTCPACASQSTLPHSTTCMCPQCAAASAHAKSSHCQCPWCSQPSANPNSRLLQSRHGIWPSAQPSLYLHRGPSNYWQQQQQQQQPRHPWASNHVALSGYQHARFHSTPDHASALIHTHGASRFQSTSSGGLSADEKASAPVSSGTEALTDAAAGASFDTPEVPASAPVADSDTAAVDDPIGGQPAHFNSDALPDAGSAANADAELAAEAFGSSQVSDGFQGRGGREGQRRPRGRVSARDEAQALERAAASEEAALQRDRKVRTRLRHEPLAFIISHWLCVVQ